MRSIDRLALFAVICFIAVAGLASCQHSEGAVQEERASPRGIATAALTPAESMGRADGDAIADTENDREGSDRVARADLIAQRWMALFAGLQVLLTFGGLLYIRWTLQETRKAVGEAADATKAAQDTVQVTRETAAQQLRAYVGAKGVNFHYSSATERFAVAVELANFGQTPAYHFNLRAGLHLVPMPLGTPPDIGSVEGTAGDTLHPTMTTNTFVSLGVPSAVVNEINAEVRTIIFTLRLKYKDHTGAEHAEDTHWYFNVPMNGGPLTTDRGGTLSAWPGSFGSSGTI